MSRLGEAMRGGGLAWRRARRCKAGLAQLGKARHGKAGQGAARQGFRSALSSGMAGRKRKLTDEIALGIADAIQHGAYRERAAALFGIGKTTLYRWMQLGKRFPEGQYGQFRELVLLADTQFEKKLTDAAEKLALAGDGQMIRWLAERKYPQRYGQYRGELGELQRRIKELEKLLGQDETTDPEAE